MIALNVLSRLPAYNGSKIRLRIGVPFRLGQQVRFIKFNLLSDRCRMTKYVVEPGRGRLLNVKSSGKDLFDYADENFHDFQYADAMRHPTN